MFTLCYPFRPWSGTQAIATAPRSWTTPRDRAGVPIDRRIRFHHRVVAPSGPPPTRAGPSTSSAATPARRSHLPASCSRAPATTATTRLHAPTCPGIERFAARSSSAVLARRARLQRQARRRHRQRRDRGDLDSGAGRSAAHVTMLQRSPSYIISSPRSIRAGRSAACCRAARLSPRALEERVAGARDLRFSRRGPRR